MRLKGIYFSFLSYVSTVAKSAIILVFVGLLMGQMVVRAQDAAALVAPNMAPTDVWAQAAPDLDIYGGSTALACPTGPAAHFYTQKIGTRWWLCTPAGNVFWLRSVYHVDGTDDVTDHQGVKLSQVLTTKYGNSSTKWGPATVARLRSWGFNGTSEYSVSYVLPTTTHPDWTTTPDNSNPEKMAFTGLVWPAHYARNPSPYGTQPVKELVGPTKEAVYTGQRRKCVDVFDPNLYIWLQKYLQDYTNPAFTWIKSPHSKYLIGLNIDETDELFGFGAGPDFAGFYLGNPADFAHVHLGWITLVTPPTQSVGKDANDYSITYTDTKVYSKQALSDFLADRYRDPITLVPDISQLNLAWGSTYTTFGSSGGWGTGNGLLDEDGTHVWVPADYTRLAGATVAMQQDLDDFLLYFARYYFKTVRDIMTVEAPGILYLGPSNIGSWGAPARRQILQAAGEFVDVIHISPIPTQCLTCTDDQDRINFMALYGGDKPWINWEAITAQNDSYMSAFAIPATSAPDAGTQGNRGLRFQTMVTQLMDAKDSAGIYHSVGYKWWQYYDSRAQQANWGLVTPRDNAYDGMAAMIATGTDAWGYPMGGETANYGDFISGVRAANEDVYKHLLGLP